VNCSSTFWRRRVAPTTWCGWKLPDISISLLSLLLWRWSPMFPTFLNPQIFSSRRARLGTTTFSLPEWSGPRTFSVLFSRYDIGFRTSIRIFAKLMHWNHVLFFKATILCQFLTVSDYNTAFGMASEATSTEAWASMVEFIWDQTILEYLVNFYSRRKDYGCRLNAAVWNKNQK